MALSRAAGLCRFALRSQWACVRQVSSVTAGGEPPGGEDKPVRRVDREAQQRERVLRPPAEHTQPALPPTVYSNSKPSYEQRQLNKAIKLSTSVDKVLDLVMARLGLLNCVIVSTALSVIAKLVGNREPALWLKEDERFRQLMRAARTLMEHGAMDAQGFSNMLYACGQLGIAPPSGWLHVYWGSSALVLTEFVPQAHSNTLYACGQLGLTPPAEWLQHFWHASALKLGEFNPQALSNTLYAYGQLGITPPADWLQRFWHASAFKLSEFNEQALSNTLYACGQLGITPPADWLQRYWHASASKLGEFIPQDFSNTLYACGQLGLTPPADWLQRYWRANASKLGEFIPQDFSNTLYACGQLGITPPADWLQRFWHVSASKLGEFVPQDFSNTLYVCGQLGITPPSDWLQRFSDSFERSFPDADRQSVANTALSLAILGLWELPLLRGLWERLCHALPLNANDWSAVDQLVAQQLYQAYQAAAVERPGLLSLPDPELLAATRKSWINGLATDVSKSSRLHADISACLTRMGMAHANERWCERAERSIDIAIEGAGARVALEVDGPHHFLQNGRQDGSTLLRNRMLAAHGWRVVVVDYRTWIGLKTQTQREEFLRRLLA